MHDNFRFDRYRTAISFLATGGSRQKPTLEFLSELCPHLTASEVATILHKGLSGERDYFFALPPTRVQGGTLVASISPRRDAGLQVYWPGLRQSAQEQLRQRRAYRRSVQRAVQWAVLPHHLSIHNSGDQLRQPALAGKARGRRLEVVYRHLRRGSQSVD